MTLSSVLCISSASEAEYIFAAHNTAMLPSNSIPKAGLFNSLARAINCAPEPTAASSITPAGKSKDSIC